MVENAERFHEWAVNGQSKLGWWRIDDLGAGTAGLDMLLNPIAVVPDKANADLICKAVNRQFHTEGSDVYVDRNH